MYIIVRYPTYIICNATVSSDITSKMSPITLDVFFERIDISIGLSQPTSIMALEQMKNFLMDISKVDKLHAGCQKYFANLPNFYNSKFLFYIRLHRQQGVQVLNT